MNNLNYDFTYRSIQEIQNILQNSFIIDYFTISVSFLILMIYILINLYLIPIIKIIQKEYEKINEEKIKKKNLSKILLQKEIEEEIEKELEEEFKKN